MGSRWARLDLRTKSRALRLCWIWPVIPLLLHDFCLDNRAVRGRSNWRKIVSDHGESAVNDESKACRPSGFNPQGTDVECFWLTDGWIQAVGERSKLKSRSIFSVI